MKEHKQFITTKTLIYVNNESIGHTVYFKKGVMEEYSISCVEKADWIKIRDLRVTPRIFTFHSQIILGFIRVLGEQAKSKVNLYVLKTHDMQEMPRV